MSPRKIRNESRERFWLQGAERGAGRSGFASHALMRLAAGERAYGDRWAGMGIDHLLGELSEEAADIGAWAVLALQALEREGELGASDDEWIAARLRAAILWGAYAHYEVLRARPELHTPHDTPRRHGTTA
jgi:hypothetical protein